VNFGGIMLNLLIGKAVTLPAPYSLSSALRSVEVTQQDVGPSGFQITFQLSRRLNPLEYELLAEPLLDPWNRVILTVLMSFVPTVIMDGLITNRQIQRGRGSEPDTVVVTGQDISIAMDLSEKSMPYPAMNDGEIFDFMMLDYMQYGVVPEGIPTTFSVSDTPEETVIQQAGTDKAFIKQLASRNGYIFQITPGPLPGMNTAYFGPPKKFGVPQPALTCDRIPGANVTDIQFQYEGSSPTTVTGKVQDTETSDQDIPVDTFVSTRLPLAAEPALLANELAGGFTRKKLFDAPGQDPIQAYAQAQGMTDESTDQVLTATGEVDVFLYQSILSAPGIVGVRGAGYAHDGLYYVKKVTHKITPETYKQAFTLTREGYGATTPVVRP
jgi:hypothetical protein